MNLLSWIRSVVPAAPPELATRVTVRSERRANPGGIPLDRADVDFRRLLDSALQPLLDQAQLLDLHLQVVYSKNFPARLQVDGLKLAWSVTSLVGNSLRFSRRGSHFLPGGTIRVVLVSESGSDEMSVQVQDDGQGIPPQRLETLLSREFTSGPVHGLGLLLIEDIALAHGGRLEISSATGGPERGTTVTLVIPGVAV